MPFAPTCGHRAPMLRTCPDCRAAAGNGPPAPPVATATAARPASRYVVPDCPHLGAKLPGAPCGTALHLCNVDGATCARVGACLDAKRSCGSCTIRPAGPRPPGWPVRGDVKLAHQAAAAEFARSIGPYPEGRFAGAGVVIAGGGRYWASAYVAARMVRHHGCDLPVQVWYLGSKGEHDSRYVGLLAELGVACVDADTRPARAARRIVNGFELKLFAAMNCPFENVLLLDADCYPCGDVTPLFTEPGFLRTGGVYWPDMPGTDAWTHWDFWGVPPRGPAAGLEVGQYLVSKRRAWEQLNLAEWYDDHSDWCYGAGQWSDHGDKGPHRVAWAATGTDFTMYTTRAVWKSVAFVHPGPDGATPLFVHRCRSKFVVEGAASFATTPQNGTNVRAGLPGEEQAFDYLEELRAYLAARHRV